MNCKETQPLLSEHIDGVLDTDTQSQLREHLDKCPKCRDELDALRRTIKLLQEVEEVQPPADLLPRIHAKLAQGTEQPRGIWRIVWNPQARVALAATFVVSLCVYGFIYVDRKSAYVVPAVEKPVPAKEEALAQPAVAPIPEEPAKQADKALTVQPAKRRTMKKSLSREVNGKIWREAEGFGKKAKQEEKPAPVPATTATARARPAVTRDQVLLESTFHDRKRTVMKTKESGAAERGDVAASRTVRPSVASARAKTAPRAVARQAVAADSATEALKGGGEEKEKDKSVAQSSPTITVTSKNRQSVMDVLNAFALREEKEDVAKLPSAEAAAFAPDLSESRSRMTVPAKDVIAVKIRAQDYPKLIEKLKGTGKVTVARKPDENLSAAATTMLLHVRIVEP